LTAKTESGQRRDFKGEFFNTIGPGADIRREYGIRRMGEPKPGGDRNRRTLPWLLASMLIAAVVVCAILWRAVATSTDL
jgi:hypothetical protein